MESDIRIILIDIIICIPGKNDITLAYCQQPENYLLMEEKDKSSKVEIEIVKFKRLLNALENPKIGRAHV